MRYLSVALGFLGVLCLLAGLLGLLLRSLSRDIRKAVDQTLLEGFEGFCESFQKEDVGAGSCCRH